MRSNGDGGSGLYRNNMSVPASGPWTISGWMKLASAPGNGGVVVAGIGGNSGTNPRIDFSPTNTLLAIDNGTSDPTISNTWDTNWHYFVVTSQAASNPTQSLLYMDGASVTVSGGDSSAYNVLSTGPNFAYCAFRGRWGGGICRGAGGRGAGIEHAALGFLGDGGVQQPKFASDLLLAGVGVLAVRRARHQWAVAD